MLIVSISFIIYFIIFKVDQLNAQTQQLQERLRSALSKRTAVCFLSYIFYCYAIIFIVYYNNVSTFPAWTGEEPVGKFAGKQSYETSWQTHAGTLEQTTYSLALFRVVPMYIHTRFIARNWMRWHLREMSSSWQRKEKNWSLLIQDIERLWKE